MTESNEPTTSTARAGKPTIALALLAVLAVENGAILWAYKPWSHGLPPLPGADAADGHGAAHAEGAGHTGSGAHAGPAACVPPAPLPPQSVLELAPFIVNVADTDRHRYARATFQLGFADKDGADKTRNQASLLSPTRQIVLEALGSKRAHEVATVEGKLALREEIKKRLSELPFPSPIREVYLTDFLIQF